MASQDSQHHPVRPLTRLTIFISALGNTEALGIRLGVPSVFLLCWPLQVTYRLSMRSFSSTAVRTIAHQLPRAACPRYFFDAMNQRTHMWLLRRLLLRHPRQLVLTVHSLTGSVSNSSTKITSATSVQMVPYLIKARR